MKLLPSRPLWILLLGVKLWLLAPVHVRAAHPGPAHPEPAHPGPAHPGPAPRESLASAKRASPAASAPPVKPVALTASPLSAPPAARKPVVKATATAPSHRGGELRSPGLPRLPSGDKEPFTSPDAFVLPQATVAPQQNIPQTLPPPVEMQLPGGKAEAVPPPAPQLQLRTVLQSVEQDYPLLAAVFQERGIAAGELVAAEAPFNTKVVTNAKDVPLGFYRYHIVDSYIEQPNWRGGRTFAGYRIGTGPTFPIWFGEFETNTGGEFRAGFVQSLLQGLAIDKRRADYLKAEIARSTAEPVIRQQRIEFMRAAAIAYWEWVGAGRRYVIAKQLLDTGLERDQVLEERARRGDIARIERTDNLRIINDREAKLVAAGRKFQEAGIKLSLFYRDAVGLPVLPDPQQLPHGFPSPPRHDAQRLGRDVQVAFQMRPELRELALKRQSLNVELAWARNQRLPQVDGFLTAAKDVGSETPPIDKTPFQLEAGVVAAVPLQFSQARGSIQRTQAAIAQLGARLRWYEEKITAEVQDATSELIAAHEQWVQRREGVQLTYQMEVAERSKFDLGDSNLFILNLRELDTRDAASLEIDSLVTYYVATAVYYAALGLDGLRFSDQAAHIP